MMTIKIKKHKKSIQTISEPRDHIPKVSNDIVGSYIPVRQNKNNADPMCRMALHGAHGKECLDGLLLLGILTHGSQNAGR